MDLLVVGGGPAGCAAALTAAHAGLRVCLVEGSAFPRHRPGETLSPGVEPLLEQLGAADAFRAEDFVRHEGVWVRRHGESHFHPYRPDAGPAWQGWQAGRARFDALLLEEARRAGVDVRQPCRALSPLFAGGRVTGVVTTDGPLSAECVMDATGARRWAARHLRLPVRQHSPRLVVQYGYARGACPERDDAPLFDDHGTTWTWTARVEPGLYHWTRLLAPGEPARCRWQPPEFAGLQPVDRVRGADVTWTDVSACAGPGYVMLGDAAALVDPSSSHGVLRALLSGILAAHLLSTGLPEPRRAALYRHWIEDSQTREMAALRALRGAAS